MHHLLASGAVLFSFLSGCATSAATVDGVAIHYTDVGEGDRTLVFVHGWASDSTIWSEQIPQLTHLGRLIAIDLPGHGRSDKPELEYSMAYWARSVNAVLERAGVKKAILLGHSNGVPVVRQFYRDYPEKTLALVTVDGALVQMGTLATMRPFLKQLRAATYLDFARQMTRSMTKLGNLTDEQAQRIEATAMGTPQHVMVAGLLAAVDDDVWKPGQILVPVLMVNTKQPSWDQKYKDQVRALVPNLDYHELEGVNHCLMMDEPEKFHALLEVFLAKLE